MVCFTWLLAPDTLASFIVVSPVRTASFIGAFKSKVAEVGIVPKAVATLVVPTVKSPLQVMFAFTCRFPVMSELPRMDKAFSVVGTATPTVKALSIVVELPLTLKEPVTDKFDVAHLTCFVVVSNSTENASCQESSINSPTVSCTQVVNLFSPIFPLM